MEFVIIYHDEEKGWLQDGRDGIKTLSIGITDKETITRGRILARMIYLGWTFMHENAKGEIWFQKR